MSIHALNCSCILRPYISSACQKSSHFRRLSNDNACQTGSAPKYRRILTFGPIVHGTTMILGRVLTACWLFHNVARVGSSFVRTTVEREMNPLNVEKLVDVPERTLGRDFHSSLHNRLGNTRERDLTSNLLTFKSTTLISSSVRIWAESQKWMSLCVVGSRTALHWCRIIPADPRYCTCKWLNPISSNLPLLCRYNNYYSCYSCNGVLLFVVSAHDHI